MKLRMIYAVIMSCVTITLCAQTVEQKTKLTYRVPVTDGWVYYAPQTPAIEVVVGNDSGITGTTLQLDVMTDQRQPLQTLSQDIHLAKGDSSILRFAFSVPEPGFYRLRLTEKSGTESVVVKQFNIGYEPTAIVSLPNAQPDMKEFWDKARAELDAVAPEYKLEKMEPVSSSHTLYKVTMKSLGGVEIAGYYSVPAKMKKGQKLPTLIYYMGYGSQPWKPGGKPGYIEFVLSTRGQGLNAPTNIYGDWVTYRLDSKDEYYYRGAFMDLIRGIDFVASRPEVDAGRIVAEGGSQGGAFTLAACALDDRLRAGAPTIPFLSDYKDYFRIVHWPGEPILNKQKELRIPDEQLYTTLSYFDIKNLAGWIKCPIIMGVGLQDEVCPPHTNFSSYNRISSEKAYHIYPLNGHNTAPEWNNERDTFFQKVLYK